MDARQTEYKTAQIKETGEFVRILYRDWSNLTFRIEYQNGKNDYIKQSAMDRYTY